MTRGVCQWCGGTENLKEFYYFTICGKCVKDRWEEIKRQCKTKTVEDFV